MATAPCPSALTAASGVVNIPAFAPEAVSTTAAVAAFRAGPVEALLSPHPNTAGVVGGCEGTDIAVIAADTATGVVGVGIVVDTGGVNGILGGLLVASAVAASAVTLLEAPPAAPLVPTSVATTILVRVPGRGEQQTAVLASPSK